MCGDLSNPLQVSKTFFSSLFVCFCFLFLHSVSHSALCIITSNSLAICPFFLTRFHSFWKYLSGFNCVPDTVLNTGDIKHGSHSFWKYLSRFNCVPDTVLSTEDITHGSHSQEAGGNRQIIRKFQYSDYFVTVPFLVFLLSFEPLSF